MNIKIFASLTLALLFLVTGCETTNSGASSSSSKPGTGTNQVDTTVRLREGDAIAITFPSAKALDVKQVIRRDGRIAIPSLGELAVVGMTPEEVQKAILKEYGNQLVSKEVTVTIESIAYSVYVNGAVMRPGKIQSTRPLKAVEAIVEAGGFNRTTANLKKVKVIRTEGGSQTFTLDFSGFDKGQVPDFLLQPSDIIVVPERFNLF